MKTNKHGAHGKSMNVFWWKDQSNFGDALADNIVTWLTGQRPTWSDRSSKYLTIGSIIHFALPGDSIWGSGLLTADAPPIARCRVLAVRGPLTRQALKVECPMGEPGLLVPLVYPDARPRKPADIGLVPHHSELPLVKRHLAGFKIIDVTQPPKIVVESILGCKRVLSSSLHGLVVADAYQIPSIYVRFTCGKECDIYQGRVRNIQVLRLLPRGALQDTCSAPATCDQPPALAAVHTPKVDLKQLLDSWA